MRVRLGLGERRLNALHGRLEAAILARVGWAKQRLAPLGAELVQLSPLKILERGYAIVQTADGRVVTGAAMVEQEQHLGVRLGQGRIGVKVTSTS